MSKKSQKWKQYEQRNEQTTRGQDIPIGQSWWNNQTIISHITDEKIRQTIQYHQQMVDILEEELRFRTLGIRAYIPFHIQELDIHNEEEFYNSNETTRKETNYILKSLRKTLQVIRRKHGQMAFEEIKYAWKEILDEYFQERR